MSAGDASGATTPCVELRGVEVAPAAGLAASSVLHDIDLRIAPGEQLALIGASGAGKSTLLMTLAGVLVPRRGTLRLFGQVPSSLSARAWRALQARLIVAPQVPPLPPRQRTVAAVLAARLPGMGFWRSLRMLWWPRADAHEAGLAQAALVQLDLPDKLWLRVDRLSGGERQRVGLARVLVSGAPLWLIDEPLSALDPTLARQTLSVLCEAARTGGRTLVCSLHQVDLALAHFPRVVALREGRIVYDGPPAGLDAARLDQVYANEASARAAASPAPVGFTTRIDVPPGAMCR